MANPNQVAGGHKAAINNDQVPEESKENSKKALEEMEQTGETSDSGVDGGVDNADNLKNESNVIGGHKATLSNPRVGEEAKEHSRQVLKEHGVEV